MRNKYLFCYVNVFFVSLYNRIKGIVPSFAIHSCFIYLRNLNRKGGDGSEPRIAGTE